MTNWCLQDQISLNALLHCTCASPIDPAMHVIDNELAAWQSNHGLIIIIFIIWIYQANDMDISSK